MLRVFMRAVIERSSSAISLPESIEILRVLSLASASLTPLTGYWFKSFARRTRRCMYLMMGSARVRTFCSV